MLFKICTFCLTVHNNCEFVDEIMKISQRNLYKKFYMKKLSILLKFSLKARKAKIKV